VPIEVTAGRLTVVRATQPANVLPFVSDEVAGKWPIDVATGRLTVVRAVQA
jgi:hypothetical protein